MVVDYLKVILLVRTYNFIGNSKKALTSHNTITLRGIRPWVVRCISEEVAQTTHDPAQDKNYLRLGLHRECIER
jgi:hypothetical protein